MIGATGIAELEDTLRDTSLSATVRQRAEIVLLHAEGVSTREIATRLGVSPTSVLKWPKLFAEHGIAALLGGLLPAEPGPPEGIRAAWW